MRGENPLIFFGSFFLLTNPEECGIIEVSAARPRPRRAEFLSIDGLHKFLGQIFVHNVNRQNPESVLYYNHSKGRKTHKTGKG